jgi:hypothetical protein
MLYWFRALFRMQDRSLLAIKTYSGPFLDKTDRIALFSQILFNAPYMFKTAAHLRGRYLGLHIVSCDNKRFA